MAAIYKISYMVFTSHMAARMEEQVLVYLPPGADPNSPEARPSDPERQGGGVEVARATEGRSLGFWVAPAAHGQTPYTLNPKS